MTRPVALKSSDITMVNRVALRLWPVDTEPKARRMVKAARIFSTVGTWVGHHPRPRHCHPCLSQDPILAPGPNGTPATSPDQLQAMLISLPGWPCAESRRAWGARLSEDREIHRPWTGAF